MADDRVRRPPRMLPRMMTLPDYTTCPACGGWDRHAVVPDFRGPSAGRIECACGFSGPPETYERNSCKFPDS